MGGGFGLVEGGGKRAGGSGALHRAPRWKMNCEGHGQTAGDEEGIRYLLKKEVCP